MNTKEMLAAQLLGPCHLEIKKMTIPACFKGGVLIQVKACGICSSDVKMTTHGHSALKYPRILGHEISGIVIQSRSGLANEGDRVQIAPGLKCGACKYCQRGEDNQCMHREILGFTYDGGFAEYLYLPLEGKLKGSLNKLPSKLSFGIASLAEPLACCLNSQEKCNIHKGDVVLIIGAGVLGILHSLCAKLYQADKVIVSEINEYRKDIALKLWADEAINPLEVNLYESIMAITMNAGVDVIILACSNIVFNDIYTKLLSPRGRVSIFSGVKQDISEIKLMSNILHYNEINISGSYGCTSRQNSEAIELIMQEELKIKELITQRVLLNRIDEGFEYTNQQKGIKSIMEVGDE